MSEAAPAEATAEPTTIEDLREAWSLLTPEERAESIGLLKPEEAVTFFHSISARSQSQILLNRPPGERKMWMRLLAPDDAADVLQELSLDIRPELLGHLDEPTRREVNALLAYKEDQAGGLMSPRFVHLRPDMTVDEAIRYVRRQARDHVETIYYVYVLDADRRLQGVMSFRQLLTSPENKKVSDVMRRDILTVPEDMDQEAVARVIARHDILAVPVVDGEGRMKGIVTIDDVVDVVESEATEDIQKIGGMAALDAPYLQTGFRQMLWKRAGWLSILFLGEMLTASAMGRYEDDIARAVVLALFVPLIISSGGNSGSQATTLVIRAMALGQVKTKDWWRVARREVVFGLCLGAILATIGFLRIILWEEVFPDTYGDHAFLIALTVATSLVGVVMWGTLSGSTLPFLLNALGLDPASASAPFVATLVDLFGLVIYFSAAQIILRGTLL